MKLEFLGDALDHWKGSLFESFQGAGVLQNFAADPMASDLPSWKPEDFLTFAKLLRIRPSQIVHHKVVLQHRASYFGEIAHLDDIFLDPDTGIATGRVTAKHVSPSELARLLDSHAARLLVVYQHGVRGLSVPARVDAVITTLLKEIGRFSWTSYESGTVAMLFLSRTPERTGDVARHFRATLASRHSSGRIRCQR